jgi:hypothetical protein
VTGLSCGSSTSGGDGPAMLLCLYKRTSRMVSLECYIDVSTSFRAGSIPWAQRGRPTLQLDAGPSCSTSTLCECCMAA